MIFPRFLLLTTDSTRFALSTDLVLDRSEVVDRPVLDEMDANGLQIPVVLHHPSPRFRIKFPVLSNRLPPPPTGKRSHFDNFVNPETRFSCNLLDSRYLAIDHNRHLHGQDVS